MKTLRDLVDLKYIVIAFFAIVIMEYILISVEAFQDFPSIVASIQLYLVATILMLVIYHYIWDVQYSAMLNILVRSLIFFIIPIGYFWAYVQGYVNEQLLSLEWQLIHDMVYVVLTTQFISTVILILGMKEYIPERTENIEDVDGGIYWT